MCLTLLPDLTPQEIHKIREAIKNASSLQEVERLTRMLQSGQIPGQKPLQPPVQTNGQRKIYLFLFLVSRAIIKNLHMLQSNFESVILNLLVVMDYFIK